VWWWIREFVIPDDYSYQKQVYRRVTNFASYGRRQLVRLMAGDDINADGRKQKRSNLA
jgi:hypothetical protein